MYLGDFQLGDRVPLTVFCTNASGAPVSPDAAPAVSIFLEGASAPAFSMRLPPADRVNTPGLFLHALHLDGRFTTGEYVAHVSWLASGAARATLLRFGVLPGGHADGAVIAMYPYRRPHADFLVQQTDGRKLLRGRNPVV